MNVTVKVEGLKELGKFGDNGLVQRELRRAMDRAVKVIQARAQDYPPAPSSSTYDRTRLLGNSWTTEVKGLGGELRGVVGNAVPYAPRVMGITEQASVHQGRWKTIKQIAEEKTQEITELFEDAARRIVQMLGG